VGNVVKGIAQSFKESKPIDKVQTVLDIAGMVPLIGEVADGANALIYLARGDFKNASLSAVACIPVIGSAGTGAKLGIKGVDGATSAYKAAKTVGEAADLATDVKRVKATVEVGEQVASTAKVVDSNTLKAAQDIGSAKKAGQVVEEAGELTQLQKNKMQGLNFEQEIKNSLSATQNNVVEQITIKTDSGVRTRIDLLGNDVSTGDIILTEAKSSATAPLTKNQKLAFPEISETGGVIVGKGKEPFVGGTKIPPTKVQIVRPEMK
ncbi:MAG: hypothetical protein ACK5HT_15300, partial [Draconibacterium sp.]